MIEIGLRAKRSRPLIPMYLLRHPADHSRTAYSQLKNTTNTISCTHRHVHFMHFQHYKFQKKLILISKDSVVKLFRWRNNVYRYITLLEIYSGYYLLYFIRTAEFYKRYDTKKRWQLAMRCHLKPPIPPVVVSPRGLQCTTLPNVNKIGECEAEWWFNKFSMLFFRYSLEMNGWSYLYQIWGKHRPINDTRMISNMLLCSEIRVHQRRLNTKTQTDFRTVFTPVKFREGWVKCLSELFKFNLRPTSDVLLAVHCCAGWEINQLINIIIIKSERHDNVIV